MTIVSMEGPLEGFLLDFVFFFLPEDMRQPHQAGGLGRQNPRMMATRDPVSKSLV